jgi:two-component system, NtrC family, sensor kinase
MRSAKPWASEETTFVILRALAMLGGVTAVLLVQHPPAHRPFLSGLAWAFVAYKALLFLAIRVWTTRHRLILLATTLLDLVFVSLFVWFSGGLESHFYILFYILIALAAAYFGAETGIATAAAASALYSLASAGGSLLLDWHHLVARVATFFLLGGSLGYLSRRERMARAEAERLNEELSRNQLRLERAYADLQAAQGRLVRSERLATIGQMSAKVSHEVRNPLSSISLNVELLEDELASLPVGRRTEAENLIRAIRSQVDVLGVVTESYLQFARLPKPKLEVAPLGPLIVDLADFVREELRARKVQLDVEVQPGLPAIRVDPGQIRQVLLNLLRNAAEAMPDGGTIRLDARTLTAIREGAEEQGSAGAGAIAPLPSVEITVTDTGVGIPPQDLGQIFEPFFTRKEGGTGLGLAISREIAVGHGGVLSCESEPGQGTIFRLTLPVSETETER